ncbi:MAG: DNA cytosine methyltransferase [Gammaproteobacteria bacterium]|nr:DNA cytosine methyltransferase [Gammaproteobacteria bacterium]MYG97203.1 DNA cytosine methyltransferase [Gammaproteobacteria bacterium]
MNDYTAETAYAAGGLEELSKWTPGTSAPNAPDAQVIDLFCGCGGMSLGFAAIGKALGAYKIVGALDINGPSLDTFYKNFGVEPLNLDIRHMAEDLDRQPSSVMGMPNYDWEAPLVLIGCAPCQGFSAHRKRNWNLKDERNNLIEPFTEIAIKLQPKCIVMENVPELLSQKYWKYFMLFKEKLEDAGYTVKQSIHNAAEFGVPQERFRSIAVAMKREDFSLPTPRLDPDEFLTVRDAIGDLPAVMPGVKDKNDSMHRCAAHRAETIRTIEAVPKNGGSRPKGVGPRCLEEVNGYYDVYGRLAWDRPSITVTHYARNPASGRFVHPEQNRGLTQREAARLQGFPDGFEFSGRFDDVFRQIGEAVPPPLAVGIAASTLANLRNENNKQRQGEIIQEPVSNSYASVIAGIKARRR